MLYGHAAGSSMGRNVSYSYRELLMSEICTVYLTL